jgi:hypothetical protein
MQHLLLSLTQLKFVNARPAESSSVNLGRNARAATPLQCHFSLIQGHFSLIQKNVTEKRAKDKSNSPTNGISPKRKLKILSHLIKDVMENAWKRIKHPKTIREHEIPK